eukprot:scaffold4723_cov144-Skeletonema_marinoi.AAC.1
MWFIVFVSSQCDRNDHTTVTAPLPVCSAKLSTVGPDFSPVHRIALQYSFCSDRLAWHGGKAMTICTYFVSYYLLMRRCRVGVGAVPPLECWNN